MQPKWRSVLGANVVIIERSADRMRAAGRYIRGRLRTLMSNPHNIASAVQKADLLIGAVLIPGARAPRLVTEAMVRSNEARRCDCGCCRRPRWID